MKHHLAVFLLSSSLLLSSCDNTPIAPNPTKSQDINISTIPAPSPTPALQIIQLSVQVKDGKTEDAIPNAEVKITSPNGEGVFGNTNNDGIIIFKNLMSNLDYNIVVSANEYTYKQFSINDPSIVKTENSATLSAKLTKAEAVINGKIIDPSGSPVKEALISYNDNIISSDNMGQFQIQTSSAAKLNIKIAKTGFQIYDMGLIDLANENQKDLGEITLTNKTNAPVVLFDTSKSPLGSSDLSPFAKLEAFLKTSGYITMFEDIFDSEHQTATDIIVLPSPSLVYTEAEIQTLGNIIKNGKKLIVLGEWGGFGGFKAGAVNSLLNQANLEINEDIVKETNLSNYEIEDDFIITSNLTPHSITNGIGQLAFYGSASVNLVNIQENMISKILVRSSSNSFRIKTYTKTAYGLVAVSNLGLGKVIVFGDTSFLLTTDSNVNGKTNLDEKDNKQLFLNTLKW